MGSIGELLFGLLLVLVIGLIVVAIIRQFMGAPTHEYEKATRHLRRPSLRRAVMRLAETLAVIQVIILTIGGGIGGGVYAGFIAGLAGQNVHNAQATGALLGAGAGFLSAMVITGLLFTLAAIEENTRTTAAMLAMLARPREQQK